MSVSDEQQMDRILDRWEAERAAGRDISVEQLCAHAPHLQAEVRRRLAAIRQVDRFRQAGGSDSSIALPRPGDVIGTYRVVRRLAAGGMGVVYLCRQQHPDRDVAVKILQPAIAHNRSVRRFAVESQVLGALRHEGIARILEQGTACIDGRDTPFIAMEYVAGRHVDQYVREQQLRPRQILELLARICDAIHYAHCRGIIHRDIKPSNVLVESGGQPVVLDFGIACPLPTSTLADLVRTHPSAVGSLSWMSPEQLNGPAEDLDPRTDVYSLCALGYELLTGRLPHELRGLPLGRAVEVVTHQPVTPAGRHNPELAGDIESVIAKGLSRNRSDRYDSAEALAADLRRVLRKEPVQARPMGPIRRSWRWCCRNPQLAAAGCLTTLSLSIGLVISTYFAAVSHSRAARLDALTRDLQTQVRHTQTEAARARRAAANSRLAHVSAAVFTTPDSAAGQLESNIDFPPSLRTSAWALLRPLCERHTGRSVSRDPIASAVESLPCGLRATLNADRSVRLSRRSDDRPESVLPVRAAVTSRLVLSPDKRLLAFGAERGTVCLWNLEQNRMQSEFAVADAPATHLQFSDDGNTLAAAGEQSVSVWSKTAAWDALAAWDLPGRCLALQLARDGSTVQVAVSGHTVMTWNAATGQELSSVRCGRGAADRAAFAARHPWLAIVRGRRVEVRNTESGDRVALLPRSGKAATAVCFCFEDRVLAIATGSRIRTFDTESWTQQSAITTCHDVITELRPSEEERELYSCGAGWETWNLSEFPGRRVCRGDSTTEFRRLAWDADSRAVRVGDTRGTLGRGETGASGRIRKLGPPLGMQVEAIAGSPTSDQWAVAAGSAPVRLLSHTEQELHRFDTGGLRVRTLAFSPGGDHLFAGASDGSLRCWNVTSGQTRFTAAGHSRVTTGVACSPDGRRLASVSEDGTLRLWDAVSGEPLQRVDDHGQGILHVAWSPSGRWLASASRDGTARLRDPRSGETLHVLVTGLTRVTRLAFAPDDGTLITAGGALSAWDPLTGQRQWTIRPHRSVIDLAFAPDGHALATVDGSHELSLWPLWPHEPR